MAPYLSPSSCVRGRWLRSLLVGWCVVMWLGAGCSGGEALPSVERVGQVQRTIINGRPDLRHPAVGTLVVSGSSSFCTATLIAPQLVLTAAHCVDAFGRVGGIRSVQFRVDLPQGNQFQSEYYGLSQAHQHPQYSRSSSSLYNYDLAVLVLSKKVSSVTPIPPNTQAMSASWVGQNVLVMGYGLIQVSPTPRSAPGKYSAEIPIHQVGSASFIHYDQQTQKSACHGDSGGPALMQVQGQWVVVGVTSVAYRASANPRGNPPTLCNGGTRDARPDVHYASFLAPLLQQYGSGSVCSNGQTQPCYSGPPNTQGVGSCRAGVQTCQSGQWGACTGAVVPAPQETCHDNVDNNCNGQVDEGCAECVSGQTRPCYTGPPNTRGVGTCQDGTQACVNGAWGVCQGQIGPLAQETCFDQLDNNCNGQVDEGCPDCQSGQQQVCYTGPPSTRGKGTCRNGLQTCQGGAWGACVGQTLPLVKETCFDGLDNTCDGQVDEGCPLECHHGQTQACYAGAPGTLNVGLCRAGLQICNHGRWSTCGGSVLPQPEVCDGFDNNCDGQIDEICQRPQSQVPSLAPRLRPRGFGCGGLAPLTGGLWWLGCLLAWMRRRRRRCRTTGPSS